MNRMLFVNLLFGISVSSVFSCSGMNKQSSEAKIVQPSLSELCRNFRAGRSVFEAQARNTIEELKRVHGDDAVLLSLKLEKDLNTVAMLRILIETCKDGSDNKIKEGKKNQTLEICRYLTGVMPYAGKMQDVISSVLNKEFGVGSISELETAAK